MVRCRHAQRSVFEMILPDGEQLWDPEQRRIDEVLEDEELTEPVEGALRRRRPQSRLRGWPGTPAAVVLRMLVLKHLYHWSFADREREVRGSLIYRAFCRLENPKPFVWTRTAEQILENIACFAQRAGPTPDGLTSRITGDRRLASR
jgi:hypothetical protein